MLVLTRRVGEAIHIDQDIEVVVLAVTGGKVRLGITAPPTVGIHRHEVIERAGLAPSMPEFATEGVVASSGAVAKSR